MYGVAKMQIPMVYSIEDPLSKVNAQSFRKRFLVFSIQCGILERIELLADKALSRRETSKRASAITGLIIWTNLRIFRGRNLDFKNLGESERISS